MARPKILRGTYINILIGDGALPEVFSPVCGARVKNLNHVIETSDDYTRDCADPADVPTRNIVPTGERWDMPFSGVLNRTQLATMQGAMGLYKNYRFEIAQPAGDAVYGGYWAGQGMLTSFNITGDDGANATIEGTVLSNGDWTFTAVP
jgi:hypothetical protein